jgi:hypothetical protein
MSMADLTTLVRRISINAPLHKRRPSEAKIRKKSDTYVRDRFFTYGGEDGDEEDRVRIRRTSSADVSFHGH